MPGDGLWADTSKGEGHGKQGLMAPLATHVNIPSKGHAGEERQQPGWSHKAPEVAEPS